MIVPECGHNDRCVYTSDEVFAVVFPKKQSPQTAPGRE